MNHLIKMGIFSFGLAMSTSAYATQEPLNFRPSPKPLAPLTLDLNAHALAVIAENQLIEQEKLKLIKRRLALELAELTKKENALMGNNNPVSVISNLSLDPDTVRAIDRVFLRGLITEGNITLAHVSWDNQAAVRVKVGSVLNSVTVTEVTPSGVALRHGKERRWLSELP